MIRLILWIINSGKYNLLRDCCGCGLLAALFVYLMILTVWFLVKKLKSELKLIKKIIPDNIADLNVCPNCHSPVEAEDNNCKVCTKALKEGFENNEVEDKQFLKVFGTEYDKWRNGCHSAAVRSALRTIFTAVLELTVLVFAFEGYGIIPFASIIAGEILLNIILGITEIVSNKKNNKKYIKLFDSMKKAM